MRGMNTNVTLKEVNFKTLKFLIPYFTEFKGLMCISMLCLVGAKIASVGMPFILKHIVDTLDRSNPLHDAIIVPIGLLVAYALVRFSSIIFGELRDTLFGRITERAIRRVGLRAFAHLHTLDLDFHLDRKTGGLSRDIERGTTAISFLMRFMVFNIIPTLLEIGFVVIILSWNYHAGFPLLISAAVLVYIIFSVLATEWRTHFVRAVNESESESSSRALDSLLNYETVKYFTNEKYEIDLYDKTLELWEAARRKNRLSLFFLNGGQAFIISCAMGGAMIMAAAGVTNQTMTLGDFVMINAFMMQIFLPLNFLGFVYREMKGALVNIERMFTLLNEKSKVQDSSTARQLEVIHGEIKFQDVHFCYRQGRDILQGVSFNIKAKQKVAIVGTSGVGKSTLFKLLFRFYDVTAGSILIDGQDIRSVSQDSLRRMIGVVPQDAVLFNTSLIENIRYARLNASDDEIQQAICDAQLENFIQSLPDGWNTLVGERGLKLSGGEKQRVAIARAILKKPPIMVFDEATSSLDSHAEQGILQAMKNISDSQTTLVIAHRLSTIVDSDMILVLDKGQIREAGTHQELLSNKSVYAGLWQAQQKHKEDI